MVKRMVKMQGDERRALLLKWLTETAEPLKGSYLAEQTNVSRQVIVQDISLLKAAGEPIIATSQGYVFLKQDIKEDQFTYVIAANHHPDHTIDELNIIVDYGVTIKDVTVEHPVYGDITASLMLSNRMEVEDFIRKLQDTNAVLLSELTSGVHLHTLAADSKDKILQACQKLKEKGYLLT